jgi:transcriptional regulator with XRE-family HTH domain
MMDITSAQIRAARGLLNLSQKELADRAGISLNLLNNIERGVANPKPASVKAIRKALEHEGIEFLEENGVRERGEKFEFRTIEGQEILRKYYKDLLRTFATKQGEILYMGIDNDRMFHADPLKLAAYKTFEQEIHKMGVTERLLFKEGDTNFMSDVNVYRWVPKDLFTEIPVTIYGENVAIILWGPPSRMLIIRNKAIADTFRRQFEAMWALAKAVPNDVFEKHRMPESAWAAGVEKATG